MDKGEDPGGILTALHVYLRYAANVGIYSEWHPVASKVMSMIPGSSLRYIAIFTQAQIKERLQQADVEKKVSVSPQDDFLARVLRMHEEKPESFTMAHVFMTCIMNIGAGSDTTAITLSAILYNLLQQPETFQKVSWWFVNSLYRDMLT